MLPAPLCVYFEDIILKTLPFKAFGGMTIEAEVWGEDEQPTILLLADLEGAQTRWRALADALCVSGRRVILLPNIKEKASASKHVRALLARLTSRPVVIAIGDDQAHSVAEQALAKEGTHLALALATVGFAARQQATEDGSPKTGAVPTLMFQTGLVESGIEAQGDEPWDAGDEALVGDEALLGSLLQFLEQHQPLAAREFRYGSDPRTLRDAMGCFATGVTIITAFKDDGAPIGLTANSFTSVSLDPPLLLVCIAKTSSSAPVMEQVTRFGVNVLHVGQQAISSRFASKVEDRFAGLDWSAGETQVPMLDSALVAFECERHSLHDAGDHFILVGKVNRAQFESHRDPLLFYRGKYRRLYYA